MKLSCFCAKSYKKTPIFYENFFVVLVLVDGSRDQDKCHEQLIRQAYLPVLAESLDVPVSYVILMFSVLNRFLDIRRTNVPDPCLNWLGNDHEVLHDVLYNL